MLDQIKDRISSLLPWYLYFVAKILFLAIHPGRKTLITRPYRNSVAISIFAKGRWFLFPWGKTKQFINEVFRVRWGYSSYLRQKYTLENRVEIDSGDTVIDVGAFNGGFSIAAAESGGGKIIACEPSPANFNVLSKNVTDFPCISPQQVAVSDTVGKHDLNMAADPTDPSLGKPDTETIGSEVVQIETLDSLAEDTGISEVDFLKVDAEGFEPEVLRRFSTPIRKIAVDVSAEREGQSTREEVRSMLEDVGYECQIEERYGTSILFAWDSTLS